jgi:hypothetical protein
MEMALEKTAKSPLFPSEFKITIPKAEALGKSQKTGAGQFKNCEFWKRPIHLR